MNWCSCVTGGGVFPSPISYPATSHHKHPLFTGQTAPRIPKPIDFLSSFFSCFVLLQLSGGFCESSQQRLPCFCLMLHKCQWENPYWRSLCLLGNSAGLCIRSCCELEGLAQGGTWQRNIASLFLGWHILLCPRHQWMIISMAFFFVCFVSFSWFILEIWSIQKKKRKIREK